MQHLHYILNEVCSLVFREPVFALACLPKKHVRAVSPVNTKVRNWRY